MQMFLKVFTHREIIHRIPMCAHNENCGFMRTYIPFCIESGEKVSSTKSNSKLWLNKRNTYLSRCSLSFGLSLFFHYSAPGVASHNERGQYY